MTALTTSIIRFDSLGSTNTEATKLAIAGVAEGTCVVAREQTAGRGRLEREWISPLDAGLYFSIVLRPQIEPKSFPLITLMASLAVRDALREACGLETDIKWPNDVLAEGKKLCGILAETVDTQSGRAVILGIGINLKKESLPTELATVAISIEGATGRVPDSENVLQALTGALGREYDHMQSPNGDLAMLAEWRRASSYANGKRVSVSNNGQIIDGVTDGLELDGALRVLTPDGKVVILRAGEVTAVRQVE